MYIKILHILNVVSFTMEKLGTVKTENWDLIEYKKMKTKIFNAFSCVLQQQNINIF